jgi:hypothetical protein
MRLENLYMICMGTETVVGPIPIEDYADSSLKRLIWVPETTADVIYLESYGMYNTWQPKPYDGYSLIFFKAKREYLDYHQGAWYRPCIKEFREHPKRNGDRRHQHSNDMYKWLWKYEDRRREVATDYFE